jgi:hypothetical protein
MASNFFNSIKNAFVTVVPDEEVQVENVKVENTKPVTSGSKTSETFSVGLTTPQPKIIEGQVDDELLQKLCQVMEDGNLPGPDYLELKNVANNDEMKRAMPNETQRLTVAFITMKSSSSDMTKERVLSSIDEYIKMMENERKTGHEQLQNIWNDKVETPRKVVAETEKEVIELQKKLQELVSFIQTKNNEIATAINECNIKKADFDTTVDFLVNNLKEDKTKLTNVLN